VEGFDKQKLDEFLRKFHPESFEISQKNQRLKLSVSVSEKTPKALDKTLTPLKVLFLAHFLF
jgi:hypothetical protein